MRRFPEDLRVLSAPVPSTTVTLALMAMVTAAEYTLTVMDENVAASLAACKDGFLSQEAIITPRKTKSGVKDCDVRQAADPGAVGYGQPDTGQAVPDRKHFLQAGHAA